MALSCFLIEVSKSNQIFVAIIDQHKEVSMFMASPARSIGEETFTTLDVIQHSSFNFK